MDLTNKSELIKYLKQNELWANKSLGQNFLVDREVLNKIVEAAELKKTDTVLEIGPGFGVLTQELVKNSGKVIAIEKDDKMVDILNSKFLISNVKLNSLPRRQAGKIQIIKGDVLDFDFETYELPVSPGASRGGQANSYKLISNIPYYITSKILEKFLSAKDKPELIVLLVQKEVAERICAPAGDTSVLSIAVQFYGEPEIIATVKSSSFFPAPNVESAILKIANIKSQITNKDEAELFKIVRAGFRSRRKTLVNNLMSGTSLSRDQLFDILNLAGLQNNIRAQELSVDQWIELTKLFKNYKTQAPNHKQASS